MVRPRKNSPNPKQLEKMRELWEEGHPAIDIGERFNLSKETIYSIAHREHWSKRQRGGRQKGGVRKEKRLYTTKAGSRTEKSGAQRVAENLESTRARTTDFYRRLRIAPGFQGTIVQKPTGSMFGAPIRELSPDLRALVDEFLEERG